MGWKAEAALYLCFDLASLGPLLTHTLVVGIEFILHGKSSRRFRLVDKFVVVNQVEWDVDLARWSYVTVLLLKLI